MSTSPVRPELWTVHGPVVGRTVGLAVEAEADGWDGITLGDSQNIVGDVWVEMALAAAATSRLKLATWVTNPYTRHPAVTAGAAATLQAESGGRVEVSIGRGDSALAHLGLSPAPLDYFEAHVERLALYLAGREVPFRPPAEAGPGFSALEPLGLGEAPRASALDWLDSSVPKVPLFVGATGPRVMAVGARLADGVLVSVGTDPGRLGWARDTIAAAGGGRRLVVGAHFPVAVHPDPAVARRLVASKVAVHARFSVMHGRAVGPTTEDQRRDLAAVRAAYDMTRHARHGTTQTAALTDELVEAFAVAGPAEHCVEQLAGIAALGFDKLLINTAFPGTDPAEEQASRRRLVEQVLPALR
jgi:5,10-methylenetetrahydromethanopterin reductase